ncbi:uncharacterized protein BYT42DRAFT_157501 [Radiomyces spectabilis]|uniref:uncharacterized protein n=1 Tax=Radiomyces spectabilis TaxID=64574 RepID=UPI002220E54B|nr:uncharacterized protein BYT42DRAFT_157501 [Radiomyces spectabilis]KAI8365240.1 hypothetical protein BYT42DRAFT_157501 [Radiomyces spectabilis]
MRRASLACLFAVHVSGWFARPDDNHRGWKQAYETFALSRDMQSAFFLFNRKLVLTVLNYVTTRQCLPEGIVEQLLCASFKPPQASGTVAVQTLARNRRIQVDLPVRPLATSLLSIPTEQQQLASAIQRHIHSSFGSERITHIYSFLSSPLTDFAVQAAGLFVQEAAQILCSQAAGWLTVEQTREVKSVTIADFTSKNALRSKLDVSFFGLFLIAFFNGLFIYYLADHHPVRNLSLWIWC